MDHGNGGNENIHEVLSMLIIVVILLKPHYVDYLSDLQACNSQSITYVPLYDTLGMLCILIF